MRRLRHAVATTFWIYVITTLLAAVPTIAGLSVLSVPTPADQAGGAALLEAFEDASSGLTAGTLVALMLAGLTWALSPLLQMAWLAALDRPQSVASALALGASRYLRAVLISLVMLLPGIVVAILLVAPPAIAHLALADDPNARTHDLVVGVLLVPGLFALAVWAAWHDLARADLAVAGGGPVEAIRSGWRHLRGPAVVAYLGWYALAALLGLLGHALGGWLDGAVLWQALVVLALGQLLALSRIACRGAWLGSAVERVAFTRRRVADPEARSRP